MFVLGSHSRKALTGVHPALVRVVQEAIRNAPIDFRVIEGLRTAARQAELVRIGASKTLNSRHLTGHAVDIVPLYQGKISWDWPLYHRLAPHIKEVASALNVPITWGGDWRTFKDGPHWELPWKDFPK